LTNGKRLRKISLQIDPCRIEMLFKERPTLERVPMSRLIIAAALIVSFSASVRAAAPTLTSATAISGGTSGVVTCPTRQCVAVRPGVRI
jgi:hypothetical protein